MRYSQYTTRDEVDQGDGDASFVGVNMKAPPDQVAEGYVSAAENLRFCNGVAEPRGGIRKLPWLAQFGVTWPLVFPFGFDSLISFGSVHGAGVFDDPNGDRWAVIAAGGKVYRTMPGGTALEVKLPEGVVLEGRVRFVQAFNRVVLLRGASEPLLALEDWTEGFVALEAPEAESGGLAMPGTAAALYWENRLIAVDGRDELAVSDVLNIGVTSVAQRVRVNVGSSDPLVAVAPYANGKLVVAKESSVYIVSDLEADSAGRFTSATCKTLTTAWGIIAPGSLVAVGSDLWGLAPHGVVSIGLTESGEVQWRDVPVSEAIEPLLRRLHREEAAGAVAAVWENKYYLALPLDDGKAVGLQLLAGGVYDGAGRYELANLEIGGTYRIEFGEHEGTFMDLDTAQGEVREFTAGASTLELVGEANKAVTAKVWRVHAGVNNAVVVYDLQRRAWCGLDTSEGLMVLDWLKLDHQGRERLFFLGADGWINLYEEGYEDEVEREVVTPWTEVVVTERPPIGATLTVAGTTITATRGTRNTGAAGWGANDLQRAARNLWDDGSGRGWKPGLVRGWTAPSVLAEAIPGGLRFWGQDGLAPTVTASGAWADIVSLGKRGVVRTPIRSRLLTRGYRKHSQDQADSEGTMVTAYGQQWDFAEARLRLLTWDPHALVSVSNGVAAQEAAQIVRDRTRWLTVKTRDEYVEDFSVVCSDDMGVWDAGKAIDAAQMTEVAVELRHSGTYCQVEVVNERGRCEVAGVRVSAVAGTRRTGTVI